MVFLCAENSARAVVLLAEILVYNSKNDLDDVLTSRMDFSITMVARVYFSRTSRVGPDSDSPALWSFQVDNFHGVFLIRVYLSRKLVAIVMNTARFSFLTTSYPFILENKGIRKNE